MAYRIEQTGVELQGILNDAAVTKQGLEDEVARAQAAEGVLQENIDSEAGERQSADALLAGNIGTEVARAQQAENDLSVRIDANAAGVAAEVARAQEAEGQVWDTLNDEILTRQSQDAALQGNIEREAGLREAGDGQLQDAIDAISGKIPVEASEDNELVDAATFEAAIDGKQDALTFDEEPTEGSENPVTSGGVASAVATLQGLYAELRDGKADKATTLAGYGIEDAYTKDAVDEMIGALSRNEIVVGALPQTGEEGVIYRVPGNGYYTDYMYYDGEFVELAQYSMEFDQTQVGYFTCDTAAGTAAKTVSAAGYTLAVGGNMRIKMTNGNTADNVTLNINGAGAKSLYYNGEQASSTNSWEAGEVLEVYYDGTQYQCASGGGNEDVGYLNVTNTLYTTFIDAANSISLSDRKRGMYVAANVNGSVVKKQFVGSDISLWGNDALWIDERDELVSIIEGDFRSNYIEGKKLSNGNLANDTYSRVSNPIQVNKGDNITLYTGVNDANAWSVLEYHMSSEITNATLISRILAPNMNLNTYQSTVPQDCYVCFGCGNYRTTLRNAYDVSYYVIVGKKSGLLYGTDIEDNLTSESGDKVLSAKQGNILNTGLQQQQNAYNQVDGWDVRDVTNLFHFVDNSIIRISNGSANGEEPGKLQYKSTWVLKANDNYIDVSAFQTMVVTFYSSNSEGLCFYDENYTLVDVVKNADYLNQQHEMTLELLPSYKYVRLTITDLSTFGCVLKRQAYNGLVRDNEDDISILDVTSSLLKGEKIYIDNGSAFQKIDGQFGFTRNRITFTVSTNTFVLVRIPCGIHNKMNVSASANGSTIFFLKEFYYYDNRTAYAVCSDEYESSKLDLTASETRSMYIPSDCCYLAIVYNIGRGATRDVFPSMITLENDGFLTEMNNMASSMRFYSATETNILEQMAHKNTTFFWKGSFYSLYMCDDTQGEEYVPNHKTIKVRLGIRSRIGLESTISRDIYWAKQRCGDVIISDYAPSNCGMAISPNEKYLYMYANVRPMDGELETAVMTKFSLTSKIVESGCDILTLDGDTFTLTKVIQYYNSKCGTSLPTTQSGTTVWGLNLSSQIIKASDGMYYWGIGCAVNSFGGIIVKSSDLINWQGVTAYDLSPLSTTTVWEVALAETSTGVFSVAMRSDHIYTAAYNFTTDTWTVAATVVPNTLATRPFFFRFGANHYMVCNVTGASSYATRATAAFYEVVSDGVVGQVETKMVVEGCHYAEVVNVDGVLYMFYSSDPKHIMSAQAASKIMCEVITLN